MDKSLEDKVEEMTNTEDDSLLEDIEEDKNTKKREMQENALFDLANELGVTLGQYIDDKSPIERRWLQDYTQYHGQYFKEEELGFNEISVDGGRKVKGSRVFVNLTRSKTDSAEARLADMLFPSDDRNWDIEPTPVPEIMQALNNNQPLQLGGKPVMKKAENMPPATTQMPAQPAAPGQAPAGPEVEGGEPQEQQMTEGDLAEAQLEDAHKRNATMRKEIDDQLTECRYNSQARLAIRDGVLLGTGILKGPMQMGRTRRAWVPHMDTDTNKVIHILEIKEEVKPYTARVSPWNFFPDMQAVRIADCEATFEIDYKTKLQMKELLRTPGFMEPQVRKVLEMEPRDSHIHKHAVYLQEMRALAGISVGGFDENRYQVVEYHGPIKKEILEDLGMDVDLEDPLECYEGFVWFVGDVIIKLALHHLDSQDKVYSIFNWEKDDACMFGYGVPYTMRTPQKVVNAAWRMVMDNSGLSTGPQIVINREIIEPADDSWELSPRKIWYLTDEDADVNSAFKTFEIQSHQNELMQIFAEARKLADEETNLPVIAPNGQGTAGRTFSGLSMLMNTGNVTLRRAVKCWDDDVTVPMITRYYDWNMQFNPKEELKGDFTVKARGSDSLVVKELQSQGLLALSQYTGHQVFGPMLKSAKLLRALVKSLHADPAELVKDDDTLDKEAKAREEAAKQQPQIEPGVQAKLDVQLEIAKMQQQTQNDKRQTELMIAAAKRDELIMQIMSKENISMQEVKAKYDIQSVQMDTQMQQFYDELAVKYDKGTGI